MGLVLISASISYAQSSQEKIAEGADQALQAAVERYDIALMYDLPQRVISVPSQNGIGPLTWLSMTAAANDRVLLEVGGTYLLIRPDRPPGSPSEGDQTEVMGVLNRLGDVQFQAALDGTLTLGDLAPADRAILIRNMMNWHGTHSFNPSGEERRQILALHAGAGERTVIKLAILAKYTAEVAPGRFDSTFSRVLPYHKGWADVEPGSPNNERAKPARRGLPLDFRTGKAITVADMLREANRDLHVRYRIDGRILDDPVFVSGSYDAESFDAAAQILCQLRQLQNAPLADEAFDQVRRAFLERVRSLADKEALVRDETITLTDLRQRNAATAEFVGSELAGSEQLTVTMGFELIVDAGDDVELGTNKVLLDGKEHTVREMLDSCLRIYF